MVVEDKGWMHFVPRVDHASLHCWSVWNLHNFCFVIGVFIAEEDIHKQRLWCWWPFCTIHPLTLLTAVGEVKAPNYVTHSQGKAEVQRYRHSFSKTSIEEEDRERGTSRQLTPSLSSMYPPIATRCFLTFTDPRPVQIKQKRCSLEPSRFPSKSPPTSPVSLPSQKIS